MFYSAIALRKYYKIQSVLTSSHRLHQSLFRPVIWRQFDMSVNVLCYLVASTDSLPLLQDPPDGANTLLAKPCSSIQTTWPDQRSHRILTRIKLIQLMVHPSAVHFIYTDCGKDLSENFPLKRIQTIYQNRNNKGFKEH